MTGILGRSQLEPIKKRERILDSYVQLNRAIRGLAPRQIKDILYESLNFICHRKSLVIIKRKNAQCYNASFKYHFAIYETLYLRKEMKDVKYAYIQIWAVFCL